MSNPEEVVFEQFRALVLEDPLVRNGLKRSCQVQLKQGNQMLNVTARNSEYVGVKVALCVLLLLLLMSLAMDSSTDSSAEWGLRSIDRLVRSHFPNETLRAPVPEFIQQQVEVMTHGDSSWRSEPRKLLYLDLNKKVYCNDFSAATASCSSHSASELRWGERRSLDAIDEDLKASDHRRRDLVLLRVPDYSEVDISAEELERKTTAVAVFDGRGARESTARTAMLTTSGVIIVILGGIVLLTRDLTFLSRNLLLPLVGLADEMDSICRLQLAAVSGAEEDASSGQGTSEIRLIRKTFENMKKAIKSWGKYVPWRVVQVMLQRDAEVNMEVKEMEVSIFFSDIASFTTIVESLPPERSLLLLSRYFHDMSKIIDDYGGIVLEFIGDAIMSIYGTPVRNKDHPTSAVKSALRMLDCLAQINAWCLEHDLPEVSIRCGVHTGKVLVGHMGFQSRMKYGIVGEESEIPGRLEEMNKNYSTKMLISQATFSHLYPGDFIVRPIDYVWIPEVPGGEVQVVYEVLGRSTFAAHVLPLGAAAREHAEAMVYYRERDFEQAAKKFERVYEQMAEITGHEDVPSALLRKRCLAYATQPPPPTWDGVAVAEPH